MSYIRTISTCPGCGAKDTKYLRPRLCYPCFKNPNISITFYQAKHQYLLTDDDINQTHIFYTIYQSDNGPCMRYILMDIHSLAYHLTRNLDCTHEKRIAFDKQAKRRVFKDTVIKNIITPQTRSNMNNLLTDYLMRYNVTMNNDVQKYIDYLIDEHHSNDNNNETSTALIIINKLLEAIENKEICNDIDCYSQELKSKRQEELDNRLRKCSPGMFKNAQSTGLYHCYINSGRNDIEYVMNYLQKNYDRTRQYVNYGEYQFVK